MAKNIPTIINQPILPSGKGGSEYSLPGEKKSPLQIPKSKEAMWNTVAQEADKITNTAQRIRDARDASELANNRLALQEGILKLKDKYESPEFRKNNDFDNYTKLFDVDYKKLSDRIYNNSKITNKNKKHLDLLIREQGILGKNNTQTIAEKDEINEIHSDFIIRTETRKNKLIEASMTGDFTLANTMQADQTADVEAMGLAGILNPDQAFRHAEKFNHTTNHVININRIDRAYDLSKIEDNPLAGKMSEKALNTIIKNYGDPKDAQEIQFKHYAEGKLNKLKGELKQKNFIDNDLLNRKKKGAISKMMETGENSPKVIIDIRNSNIGDSEKSEADVRAFNHKMDIASNIHININKVKYASFKDEPGIIANLKKKRKSAPIEDRVGIDMTINQTELAIANKRKLLEDNFAGYMHSIGITEPGAMVAEGKRIGVQDYHISVLTTDQVDKFKTELRTAKPEDAVKGLIGLKEKFKESDTQNILFRDLHKGGLNDEYKIILAMNPNTQFEIMKTLAEASKIDLKEIKDSLKLSTEDVKNINKSIDGSMWKVKRSLHQAGFNEENIKVLNNMHNLLLRSTYAYMNNGYSKDSAINKVVKEIIDGNTLWSEKGYSIPKKENVSLRYADMSDSITLNNIKPEDLIDADEYGNKIYSNKKDKQNVIDDWKRNGYMANVPGGREFRNSIGKTVYIKDKNGKPKRIFISWEYLRDNAHKIINEYNKRFPKIEDDFAF